MATAGETPYYSRPIFPQPSVSNMAEGQRRGCRERLIPIDVSYKGNEDIINDIHYGPIKKDIAETICHQVGEYLIRNGLTENDLKLTIKQETGHSHYTIYKDKHPYLIDHYIYFLDDATRRQCLTSLSNLMKYIKRDAILYLHTDRRVFLKPCRKTKRKILCSTDVRQINVINPKSFSSKKISSGTYGTDKIILMTRDNHLKIITEGNVRHHFYNHPNIVQMLGMTVVKPVYLVLPEEARYSLHTHITNLKSSRHRQMIKICHDICCGMIYLHLNKFLHRSLEASACIINQQGVAKIRDFVNVCYNDTEFAEPDNGETVRVPTRWAAPEVLHYSIFSRSSDVWSFGVLVWEVFNKGKIPYTTIKDQEELMVELKPGFRLSLKKKHTAYDLILENCFRYNHKHRPEFDFLEGHIRSLVLI